MRRHRTEQALFGSAGHYGEASSDLNTLRKISVRDDAAAGREDGMCGQRARRTL